MKYCSKCGAPVARRTPAGDNLPRFVCDACNTIHYTNPNMVLGCVVESGGRILLCKRSIEPRLGYWTLPAGFMENHETMEEAAARETLEEALAQVHMGGLLALVNVPHANQVHIMFRARLAGETFGAGAETSEARLFAEAEIPWDEIAFKSGKFALRRYFADRTRGVEDVHVTQVVPIRYRSTVQR